ncbi:DNA polymerase III subunit delta' [Marinicella gelatinilytica]|uniref:DNA polymerase III subunit delta' n=1 Tax=Marinicella gelatinilytica TaxID=2996017 RepID=UPI002260F870|nr:DNA polymerase III subunit delta' [Marinicella gelatinilytica]MCX7544633.1 DNA polymerase III subunit delta' [Marinicella gelatinilytica]
MIYPWLQPALDHWHKQLADGRQPQAMIIHGLEGIGKTIMSQAIVAELLCRKPQPEPCGACQSCRIFASGQHPDLMSVEAEKNLIKVAAIRSLVGFFTATAHSAPHKVAVIKQADKMNLAAANALLKVLEEPPAGSLLILETDRMHHLLPTIRSRCVQLRLTCDASQYDVVKQWLQQRISNVPSQQIAQLLAISPGRPLLVAAMAQEDMASQIESHLNELLAYLTDQKSLVMVSNYLEQNVDSQQWQLLQAIFLHWIKAKYGGDDMKLAWPHAMQQWLQSQSKPEDLILKICQLINTIMVNLNNQTKTRLLIESMLVEVK